MPRERSVPGVPREHSVPSERSVPGEPSEHSVPHERSVPSERNVPSERSVPHERSVPRERSELMFAGFPVCFYSVSTEVFHKPLIFFLCVPV